MSPSANALSKAQIIKIAIACAAILLLAAGIHYWLGARETPDSAADKLAAQNIPINADGLLAEIRAGHTENLHYFFLNGMGPGTQDDDGVSALMAAAETANKAVISLLLSALPANPQEAANAVNLKDNTGGKTALIIAAGKGDGETASQLLAHGADTQLADKNGQTPLIVAIKNKHENLLSILIAADVAQHQGASLKAFDSTGGTPLFYAIRSQSQGMVKTLLSSKADAVSADTSGVTPLMVAAESGDEAIGTLLLGAGAKPDSADNSGNTPLTIAIRHAHPEFAQLLLDKGADPDFHTSGPLALQVAVDTEPFDAQLFSTLLAHSKPNSAIDTAVIFDAIDHKNADVVKLLMDRGVDAKATNSKGETLLYHAIESGLEDAALTLIDKGADINQTGVTGLTPLERAVKHNEIKVVGKLLALGVSAEQKTTEGYTLAEMAVYSGYPEILEALLAKGAHLQKDFGLLWAIRDGGGKAVGVLLKNGAQPNVMNDNGAPALWLAASAGESDAVAAFIQYHAALDHPNTQGITPLSAASHAGQLAVVKLLVEAGANLEVADSFGMTPLAHAAYMAKPDVVEYLIAKGANIHATDKQGRSIADLAAIGETSAERDKVIALLQRGK